MGKGRLATLSSVRSGWRTPFGEQLIWRHVIGIFCFAENGCLREGGTDPPGLLREQAARCVRELKALVPNAETVIAAASARPAILDAALKLNCRAIVIATHGRSGLAHVLLGRVAEYIVGNSMVPVLISFHMRRAQAYHG